MLNNLMLNNLKKHEFLENGSIIAIFQMQKKNEEKFLFFPRKTLLFVKKFVIQLIEIETDRKKKKMMRKIRKSGLNYICECAIAAPATDQSSVSVYSFPGTQKKKLLVEKTY